MAVIICGYHPPFYWNANGDLSLFSLGTPGTLTLPATFDGGKQVEVGLFIKELRLTQLIVGSGSTTTVEVFRRRSGVNTSLGTVSLTSAAGDLATATTVPASAALRTLDVGDFLFAQMNAVQDGSPQTVVLQVSFS